MGMWRYSLRHLDAWGWGGMRERIVSAGLDEIPILASDLSYRDNTPVDPSVFG